MLKANNSKNILLQAYDYLIQSCANYPTFYEPHPRGAEYHELTKPDHDTVRGHTKVIQGLKTVPAEWKKWKSEIKESSAVGHVDELYRLHGDWETKWRFDSQKIIDQWLVKTDRDMNEGYSQAKFTLGPNGHGLFEGNLSTKVPKTGNLKKTGYCSLRSPVNIKSFHRRIPYDWKRYNYMLIRCRGDGRQYGLSIQLDYSLDMAWHDQYSWMLFTRGGPYWQVAKIPLAKFYLSHKGRIQDKQESVSSSLHKVKWLAITLSDRIPGEFRLELDWIGFCYDESAKSDFDYEKYHYDWRDWGATAA